MSATDDPVLSLRDAVHELAEKMPTALAVEQAVASMLDVVEELALGLAHGQTPEPDWADVVSTSFAEHRRALRGEA